MWIFEHKTVIVLCRKSISFFS